MPHPDTMINFGSKEVLFKLAGTPLVPADTLKYFSWKELALNFQSTLAISERVLKQNRGSVGEGIWRIDIIDPEVFKNEKGESLRKVTPQTRIRCTEAVDNHTDEHTVESFLDYCQKYFKIKDNLLVDMRFIPRVI